MGREASGAVASHPKRLLAAGRSGGWPRAESPCSRYLSTAVEVPVGSAVLGVSAQLQLTTWPRVWLLKRTFRFIFKTQEQ